MKKKTSCKHPKIPVYTADEQIVVNELNQKISNGDAGAYQILTRIATAVAVDEGRFTRETCEECKEN